MKPCLQCPKRKDCRIICKKYADWIDDDTYEPILDPDEIPKPPKFNQFIENED